MVVNVNHMAVISQSSWNASMEIVFETNTVVNVRLNDSCDKIYTHIVLPKLNILRSRVVTVRLQRDRYRYENRYSEFLFPANTGRFTIFFFFVICYTQFNVLPRTQWHIFEGWNTSDVGPWFFLCFCIIVLLIFVYMYCMFVSIIIQLSNLNKIK